MQLHKSASVKVTEPRVGALLIVKPYTGTPIKQTLRRSPFGLSLTSNPYTAKAVQKRSLLRALRRLDRTGTTNFRGHRFVNPDFRPPETAARKTAPSSARQSPRIHILTWNAGGLSSDRYQQLILWLQRPDIHLHVVAVQETCWRSDNQFQIQGWLAFHTPLEDCGSATLSEPDQAEVDRVACVRCKD